MSTTLHEQVRFRPLSRGTFVGGVIITVLVHGALGALVWFHHYKAPPPPEAPRDVMVTRLVKLGPKRPKNLLPTIPLQPKIETPPPTVKVTDDPNAAPVEKKEEKPPKEAEINKDAAKRALERARALAQATAEPIEGDPLGSTSGTANEASVGDAYATAIYDAVRKNWNVPTGLPLGQVANLEADVRVSIDADGEFRDVKLVKSSGNNLFDDSAMEAIQATRKVPPPPPEVRAKFKRGTILIFDGKDLAR